MADGDPRCDILLRRWTIPEAKLCYFAWHWRLLLAYALAEIQAIPPVLGGTGNRESFQEFTAASFQAMNTTLS